MSSDNPLFLAGKIDGSFVARAIKAGGPYTTKPLLALGKSKVTQSAIKTATERAKRFLGATEIESWRSAVTPLVDRVASDEEQALYGLGQMSAK